jgi:hypothetical protein
MTWKRFASAWIQSPGTVGFPSAISPESVDPWELSVDERLQLKRHLDGDSEVPLGFNSDTGPLPSLYSLLYNFSNHLATDPKDKVYGIYPILKQLGGDLPDPDYSKTVSEVYEEFCVTAVLQTGDLDIVLESLTSEIDDGDIPSWVPDWSVGSHTLFLSYQRGLLMTYSASRYSKVNFMIHQSPRQLRLKGIYLGFIETIGLPWLAHYYFDAETMPIYADWCAHVRDLLADTQNPKKQKKILANYHHVFLGPTDLAYPDNTARSKAHIDETALREWINSPEEKPPFRPSTHRPFDLTLLILSSDLIGTARSIVQYGDIVILAMGAKLPLVIRPVGEYYHYICTAEIYEAMSGDMWPDNAKEEDLDTFIVV